MANKAKAGVAGCKKPSFARWSKPFLAELAATSNVTAAARKAGISTWTAYEARRSNPEFNRQWQQALCEGYDHLEMELLHRLRTGEVKPATLGAFGVVIFAVPPASGKVVRAGFTFDVPVRFAEDKLEVAGAVFAAGEAPSVPVIEVREAAS